MGRDYSLRPVNSANQHAVEEGWCVLASPRR